MNLKECIDAFIEEDDVEVEEPTIEDPVVDDPGYSEEFIENATELMASAIAAGISEIEEKIGFDDKVQNLSDVLNLSVFLINRLRVRKKDVLRKSLLKYKRLGTDRFRREYRRSLGIEGDN